MPQYTDDALGGAALQTQLRQARGRGAHVCQQQAQHGLQRVCGAAALGGGGGLGAGCTAGTAIYMDIVLVSSTQISDPEINALAIPKI